MPRLRLVRSGLALAAAQLLIGTAAPAAPLARLGASSATVPAPGERGEICVVLDSNGIDVAGTQNDLSWDGGCATLRSAGDCAVNPETGKELFGRIAPEADFTYRALVLSLVDVDPIPDGPLYCCEFVAEAAPGECCAIQLRRGAASDARGNALGVFMTGGQLCVSASSGRTPTPTATAVPRAHEDDGCRIDSSAAPASPLAAILALLLIMRRRAALRRHRAQIPGG